MMMLVDPDGILGTVFKEVKKKTTIKKTFSSFKLTKNNPRNFLELKDQYKAVLPENIIKLSHKRGYKFVRKYYKIMS